MAQIHVNGEQGNGVDYSEKAQVHSVSEGERLGRATKGLASWLERGD